MAYNGWSNYATWGVALVLDNDEGIYSMVRERVEEMREDFAGDDLRYELADWLKDYTEQLCGLEDDFGIEEPSLMARQLLGAAIDDVDFDEIARNILDES